MKWSSTLQIMIYQTNTQHNKEMGFILNFIYSHLCSYLLWSFIGKHEHWQKGKLMKWPGTLQMMEFQKKHNTTKEQF